MIQFIKHRCNSVEDLGQCEQTWGVEIDLRSDVSDPKDLILSHDVFYKGESFRKWLNQFKLTQMQGPIILNTKEDGLEALTMELVKDCGIKNEIIFLDTTIPTLRKWTREKKQKNFFIRHSSIEPLIFTEAQIGFCDWAWLDCFDLIPPNAEDVKQLAKNFKTCLVSPELQGGNREDILKFLELTQCGLHAVCTKHPGVWMEELKKKGYC